MFDRESVRKYLPTGLLQLLVAALGFALAKAQEGLFSSNWSLRGVSAIQNTTLLWIILLLMLIVLILSLVIAGMIHGDQKQRLLRKYSLIDHRGFYENKENKTRVCGICLIMRSLEAPLYLEGQKNGAFQIYNWVCQNSECKKRYEALMTEIVSGLKIPPAV